MCKKSKKMVGGVLLCFGFLIGYILSCVGFEYGELFNPPFMELVNLQEDTNETENI